MEFADVLVTQNTFCNGLIGGLIWRQWRSRLHQFMPCTHQHVKDILTENVFVACLENHVLVLWEHEIAKQLQATLWEVNIHDWSLRIQLGKCTLQKQQTLFFFSR